MMNPIHLRCSAILVIIAGLVLGGSAAAVTPEESAAIKAAENWLAPVDAGRGDASWAMAAAPFKATVTEQRWTSGLRDLRKPYGNVQSRKAQRLAHVGEKPKDSGATPGGTTNDQLAIMFDTTFAGGKVANEEVTVLREKDGVWRVNGYFIR